jgi:hypothetical protein
VFSEVFKEKQTEAAKIRDEIEKTEAAEMK